MHMADALLSPAVGGVMWAAAAGTLGYSAKKAKTDLSDQKVPLMGVLGAFIFAVQMITFTIPGTGSSGHLGGGMILAILLGPYMALLTLSSVLMVQALIFSDGGLLALGCNIINLGFFPCFIAYPLIYLRIAGRRPSRYRILLGSILAATIGLQLGSLGVVIETVGSGIAELPFIAFAVLMQPIHLAIGVIEGVVTAVVIVFVWRARPEILGESSSGRLPEDLPIKNVLIGFLAATVLTGGILIWFASTHPDGLEWAIDRVTGSKTIQAPDAAIHGLAARIQEKTAQLPDYDYPLAGSPDTGKASGTLMPGKALSGLVGGALTLLVVVLIGVVLKKRAG
jgi:cobalt/nickel transport system permease protein